MTSWGGGPGDVGPPSRAQGRRHLRDSRSGAVRVPEGVSGWRPWIQIGQTEALEEGRALTGSFQTGSPPDCLSTSGAGPPLTWLVIWSSEEVKRVVNRLGVRRRRPGVAAYSWFCVLGQVLYLTEPGFHTCTTGPRFSKHGPQHHL